MDSESVFYVFEDFWWRGFKILEFVSEEDLMYGLFFSINIVYFCLRGVCPVWEKVIMKITLPTNLMTMI